MDDFENRDDFEFLNVDKSLLDSEKGRYLLKLCHANEIIRSAQRWSQNACNALTTETTPTIHADAYISTMALMSWGREACKLIGLGAKNGFLKDIQIRDKGAAEMFLLVKNWDSFQKEMNPIIAMRDQYIFHFTDDELPERILEYDSDSKSGMPFYWMCKGDEKLQLKTTSCFLVVGALLKSLGVSAVESKMYTNVKPSVEKSRHVIVLLHESIGYMLEQCGIKLEPQL